MQPTCEDAGEALAAAPIHAKKTGVFFDPLVASVDALEEKTILPRCHRNRKTRLWSKDESAVKQRYLKSDLLAEK
jgi:hypothetical protein